jgi:hypothetical protein
VSSSGALGAGPVAALAAGRLILPTTAKAANYPMTAADTGVMVTTGAGVITVTLPAAPETGRVVWVKKVDAGAGTVTVSPAAGTLDGAASQSLAGQNTGIMCQWDGAKWLTVAEIASTIL